MFTTSYTVFVGVFLAKMGKFATNQYTVEPRYKEVGYNKTLLI